MFKFIILFSVFLMYGCANMGPPEPMPVRPVLKCDNCSGLVYYGPQQAPPPDPRVQMASILTGGLTKVLGIGAGVYAATEIASTVADSGKYVVGPTNNTRIETSTLEKSQSMSIATTETTIPIEPLIVRPEVIKTN